jgi:hypothetical protein
LCCKNVLNHYNLQTTLCEQQRQEFERLDAYGEEQHKKREAHENAEAAMRNNAARGK